jgi:DNA polymerase III alpha subunit
VLPPDINESRSQFTVVPPKEADDDADTKGLAGRSSAERSEGWSIRFGLSAVKGVGESSVAQVIAEREANGRFESLEDFARRVPVKILNKKLLESLAKSGALDSMGERRAVAENYELIVQYRKSSGDDGGAQTDLFGALGTEMEEGKIEFPVTPPATPQQKLQWEKESLGMYVSSHPLAGMKTYIGRKARLIGELTAKDVGKKITVAGIQEGIKKIRTKKGDMMAIVTLEDPTGKMEVTLFPRVFNEVAPALEQPDTVLVVGGIVDYRMGQLQMRADAVKRASLSTMIKNAKETGTFNEEEAKRGISVIRRMLEEESIEAVDEEGNVIAGETVTVRDGEEPGDDFLGPLGKWLLEGMKMEGLMEKLDGITETHGTSVEMNGSDALHTIDLPARASKQLLLDLKELLVASPGKDGVRLNIGGQMISLPVTVSMSPALKDKVEELVGRYSA